ncbi:hypothetical protein SBRCBS47491_000541 [Sporothrix bragantina]|uniref:Glycosyl transferase CAP10 domain-containing protein n=1 Tax=Sporothrix bragantina TaxID=671064 RepID=A0ABP0AR77_9PEZI
MADPHRWRRILVAVLGVCCVAYLLLFVQIRSPQPGNGHRLDHLKRKPSFDNLGMSERECRATFPGLMDPIDAQVRRGPFPLQPANDLGPLQARVQHAQLRVVAAEKKGLLPPELLDARAAVLHQINRALITSSRETDSSDLDTVFSVNIQDQPFGNAWTYSLPAFAAPTAGNAPIGRAFLMPHFSFWAWRPPMVGSFARAAAAIDRIEQTLPFHRKKPQAVWRGTTRFASTHHPLLREQLLQQTSGQAWADVQALDWLPAVNADGTTLNPEAMQEASNSLMIEDFCRYKYVVHTEGITYSGRFQFHQLCGSVVLTPPIAWLQHTSHLVRPLYASDLDLEGVDKNVKNKKWVPTADEEEAWPHATPGTANLVFVAPDWSNLGATVRWLEKHPDVAEGIARRQRDLFGWHHGGKGYLSPAAEVCYWRSLLRGWRQVVQYNETEVGQGVPWELFALDRD